MHTQIEEKLRYAWCFIKDTLILTGGTDNLEGEEKKEIGFDYRKHIPAEKRINYFKIPKVVLSEKSNKLIEDRLIFTMGPSMNFEHQNHTCCTDGQ